MSEIKATITEYTDFYGEWYGLKDGTLLEWGDPAGNYWVKVNGKVEPGDGPIAGPDLITVW